MIKWLKSIFIKKECIHRWRLENVGNIAYRYCHRCQVKEVIL